MPSLAVEKVFGEILQWIRKPTLLREDVDRARQNILATLNGVAHREIFDLFNLVNARIFGQHSYGLSRYGTPESLANLDLDALENWYTLNIKRVHPVIVIKGNIQGTSFLRNFVSFLSSSKYETRLPKQLKRMEMRQGSVMEEKVRGVVLGFDGPQKGSRDEALLSIAKTILVGSDGRLIKLLRKGNPLTLDVSLVHRGGVGGGAVFVVVNIFKGKEKVVSEVIVKELERLESTPVRETEFLSALVESITSFKIKQQSGDNFVLELMRNIVAGQGENYAEKYISQIRNANRSDLMALARRYFVAKVETKN